jgi:hypothetical protein
MKDHGKKKSEQLGMPFGTASNRLKKNILFEFVKAAGSGSCHRCNLPIESVDDLTIEHKEAWLDRNIMLFWDIDNIAFSHAGCNSRAARRNPPRKEDGRPEGWGWCGDCNFYLPADQFYKDKTRWDGLSTYCKQHFKNHL